jgi:surface polysaccharide O-acyltransferase-like enzyme
VFLCLYGIGEWLCKKEPLKKLIHFLSKHSMTIFFSHILILNYLREYGTFEGSVGMLSLYLWVSALSLLFAVIYDTLVGWVKNAGSRIQKGAE